MLLFPVMVVSLVILGPGESSWSWIIGTGTSYLSDKNSNPRQFRHCLLAMLSSSYSIRLYQLGLSSLEDLLLADRCGGGQQFRSTSTQCIHIIAEK
jgi:hypothetical protein